MTVRMRSSAESLQCWVIPTTCQVVIVFAKRGNPLHKTILNEFYQIAFRKKIYDSIEMLQRDLDEWMQDYNENRPHGDKYCYGKTPMQTFHDSLPLAKEKMLQYNNNVSEQ